MTRLDGNAIAGELFDIFGLEMTAAMGTCAGCGTEFAPLPSRARYCSNACRQRAYRRRTAGTSTVVAELPGYDTGAWTLYSLAGAEATLEYHTLATDFLANLCEKLGPGPYCDASARFDGYQGESPRLDLVTSRLVEKNPPKRASKAAMRFSA